MCIRDSFGPSQGAIGKYAEAVESIEGIASIAAERAREHAAALRIADEDLVLEDRTGGVIHAEATMAALRAALLGDGATIKEGLALLTLRPGSQRLVMETEQGVIEADKVVLAGGAWMGELVPELSPLLHVCRQSVGFAKVDGLSLIHI